AAVLGVEIAYHHALGSHAQLQVAPGDRLVREPDRTLFGFADVVRAGAEREGLAHVGARQREQLHPFGDAAPLGLEGLGALRTVFEFHPSTSYHARIMRFEANWRLWVKVHDRLRPSGICGPMAAMSVSSWRRARNRSGSTMDRLWYGACSAR